MDDKRITVLVTGVGGGGVGEGIAKTLLMLPDEYRLVSTNMHPDAPILFRAEASYIVPPATSPNYVAAVEHVCGKEKVKVLIPGSEAELGVLSNLADTISSWGVVLLANPSQVVTIGDDKWLTYGFLQEHGFGTPMSALVPIPQGFWNQVEFPLIVKPRSGHAAQNVFVVNTQEELDIVLSYFRVKSIDPIIQEFVGDKSSEFTVSVLIGRKGEVLGSIAMRRKLLGGFSQFVEVESFDDIRYEAEAIAKRLGVRGPVNLQCRLTEKGYKVFEINPRFSGTAPFRAMVGFNEADILINNFLFDIVPRSLQIQTGVVGIRGLEEIIVSRESYDHLNITKLGG